MDVWNVDQHQLHVQHVPGMNGVVTVYVQVNVTASNNVIGHDRVLVHKWKSNLKIELVRQMKLCTRKDVNYAHAKAPPVKKDAI